MNQDHVGTSAHRPAASAIAEAKAAAVISCRPSSPHVSTTGSASRCSTGPTRSVSTSDPTTAREQTTQPSGAKIGPRRSPHLEDGGEPDDRGGDGEVKNDQTAGVGGLERVRIDHADARVDARSLLQDAGNRGARGTCDVEGGSRCRQIEHGVDLLQVIARKAAWRVRWSRKMRLLPATRWTSATICGCAGPLPTSAASIERGIGSPSAKAYALRNKQPTAIATAEMSAARLVVDQLDTFRR